MPVLLRLCEQAPGLSSRWRGQRQTLVHILTGELREKCDSRQNVGFSKKRGGGEMALIGKQITFRKDNEPLGE